MTRWAVVDLTDPPGAAPCYVTRWRVYARYLAAWLPSAAVIPWQQDPQSKIHSNFHSNCQREQG